MPVIDITSTPGVLVKSGSIGFGFNTELGISLPASLFDAAAVQDSIVLYRVAPSNILYKGIARKITRTLSGENFEVSVSPAETVLEGKKWTPTLSAYNKHIICPDKLLNATIGDIIENEFTNHTPPDGEEGPKDWFTSIEVPLSVAALRAAPVDTYQSSFISIIEAALSIYEHVKWFIEYDPAVTDVLPLGKLVLVDTSVGRNAQVLTVGTSVKDLQVTEDYSLCAADLRVYGGGLFTELDELLEPAWNKEDEQLQKQLVIPAPEKYPTDGKVPTGYIPWGYDLVGVNAVTVRIDNIDVPLFYGKDFWMDTQKGAIFWNLYNGSVKKDGSGAMISGDPPDTSYRKIAMYLEGFFGAEVTLDINYAGPDCYRLYRVSKPIANIRYRLAKVEDPDNPGDIIDTPVEQDSVIEAFTQVPSLDYSDYVDDPRFFAAKIRKPPEEDRIYWDERNPQFGSYKGYGVPIEQPAFEPGRRCVRFESRQISILSVPVWTEITPDDDFSDVIQWVTWGIKCRYTAWENLLETRAGIAGADYVGRFVFDEVRKYTRFDGVVMMDKSTELVAVADKVQDFYGNPQWVGTGSIVAPLIVSGPHKVATLNVGIGDKVTLNGNVGGGLAGFAGIVNGIDISALESGLASISFGPRESNRNPFAPKPPEFVDREAITRIVYDKSVYDRRSV